LQVRSKKFWSNDVLDGIFGGVFLQVCGEFGEGCFDGGWRLF